MNNRPGLDRLALRPLTFANVRQALLDRIATTPPLAGLTTRRPDDAAISAIEMIAAVADVLGFYSERLTEEYYVGTAREPASLLRLARLVGYEPGAGRSATAWLSFDLQPGAVTRIRRGWPAMTIPGQDEAAQTFETLEAIVADARIGALPLTAPPVIRNPFATQFGAVVLRDAPVDLRVGNALLLCRVDAVEEKRIAAIEDMVGGKRVTFTAAVANEGFHPDALLARATRRLQLFGAGAPDHVQWYDRDPAVPPAKRWRDAALDLSLDPSKGLPLDARQLDLRVGTRLLLDAGPGSMPRLTELTTVDVADDPAAIAAIDGGVAEGAPSDVTTWLAVSATARAAPVLAVRQGGAIIAMVNGAGALHADGPKPIEWPVDAVGTPALAVQPNGTAVLLARLANGTIGMALLQGGGWSVMVPIAGDAAADPALLIASDGGAWAYVLGRDGAVARCAVGQSIGAWESLGGAMASRPVALWHDDGATVLAQGVDRALWAWRDGAWSSLGGELAGPPVAIVADGVLEVAAADPTGAILLRRLSAGAWSVWTTLHADIAGPPALARTAPGRLELFARGTDGTMMMARRDGGAWEPWDALGWPMTDGVAVAVDGLLTRLAWRRPDGLAATATRYADQPWTGGAPVVTALPAIPDRRRARLWTIDPGLGVDPADWPAHIAGSRVAARWDGLAPDVLARGRRVIVSGQAVRHVATVTAVTPAASRAGAPSDHLLIDLDPALPSPIQGAVLTGNVALAGHGGAVREEALGHGDARTPFQRFTLAHPALSQVAGPGELPVPALEVAVAGEPWTRVDSLYGQAADARVYTARPEEDGRTVVTFGDGRTGARLPSGVVNVVARYRTGVGLAGLAAAGQVATPLERPAGLRGVTNPLPATGAADPNEAGALRGQAPASVRLFGRAVALDDMAALAVRTGLAARAETAWVWRHARRVLHLTVAGPGGARLLPDALAALRDGLDRARDVNRPLLLANVARVPIALAARLVIDPALDAEAVLAAARGAAADALAPDRTPFARTLHASAMVALLARVPGVSAVGLDRFTITGAEAMTATQRALRALDAGPVQRHVCLFAARAAPAGPALLDPVTREAASRDSGVLPPVLPAEQAWIADPARAIALVAVEAL